MPSFRELYKCVNHRNYVRNSLCRVIWCCFEFNKKASPDRPERLFYVLVVQSWTTRSPSSPVCSPNKTGVCTVKLSRFNEIFAERPGLNGIEMVGAKGFEPSTSWSRTKYLNPINALSGVAYGTRSVISPS